METFRRIRAWTRSLRTRLFLILLAGLVVAHGLSFAVLFLERYVSARAVMLTTLQRDVAVSIALLDRLPAAERPDWIPMLDRRTYRYELGPGLPGKPELSARAGAIADEIRQAVGPRFAVRIEAIPGHRERLQAHAVLSDGAPVTIDVTPELMPLAFWLPAVLLAQLLLLIGCIWFAVRLAIRPFMQFADAANSFEPGGKHARFAERGPIEVVRAATAFNAMQDRIARHLDERVRILAAISHDLQTPITRMKLRAEMADDSSERELLLRDLGAIEALVREGIAYARSVHGEVEQPARIDIRAFVESIVFDYQDSGQDVASLATQEATVVTRPHALRRILTNLIDNALKFAGRAEVDLEAADGKIVISVLDRGPGIPPDKLDAVLQPFVRLEQSRNRDTGGTGLGLAIAHQLTMAINGSLSLQNREGGGLMAKVMFPSGSVSRPV
ncbi:sensor histidine kinase [Methylobacterium nodulans]|uniref:histidine kinase n=1 Tax=Methylobacterium nodulans (strain LMG 21967 / CNCM I-2342 / ORS 2060) TaxID=460265 RepID=B8IGE6_METNO|nr:HAMP domain-containing sensor histidine kinase [Methylobacterium nodulans]ACL55846.1 histidine kinase [Methylobacterium nodulans ORS 2060]